MPKDSSSLYKRNLLFFGKCPSCDKINTNYNHCTHCSNWIKTTASTLSTLDSYDPSYREILSELEQKKRILQETICKKCEQSMHIHKKILGCVECGAPQEDVEELKKMAVQVKGRMYVMDIGQTKEETRIKKETETSHVEKEEISRCERCEMNSNLYWALCPRYYPIDEILAEEVIKVQPNDPDFRKINDILLHAENIAKVSKRRQQKEQVQREIIFQYQQEQIRRQELEQELQQRELQQRELQQQELQQQELQQQELQQQEQQRSLQKERQALHRQYEFSYQHQFEVPERQQSHSQYNIVEQYQPQFNDYEFPPKKEFRSGQHDQIDDNWSQIDGQQNMQETRNLQVNQLSPYEQNDGKGATLRASVNSNNSNGSSNSRNNIFDDDCDYQTVLRFNI